jgi:hypothetical protein
MTTTIANIEPHKYIIKYFMEALTEAKRIELRNEWIARTSKSIDRYYIILNLKKNDTNCITLEEALVFACLMDCQLTDLINPFK